MESPFYELDKEIDQLKRERDAAIAQLEAHHIPFGGIQKPLTLDEAILRTKEFGCVWCELHGEGIEEFSFFCCGVVEVEEDPERAGILLLGDEDVYTNRKETYGKTWRAWAMFPSEEDMQKNAWEE